MVNTSVKMYRNPEHEPTGAFVAVRVQEVKLLDATYTIYDIMHSADDVLDLPFGPDVRILTQEEFMRLTPLPKVYIGDRLVQYIYMA